MVRLEQHQLLAQTLLALTQRVDPTPHCRYPLAYIQVQPLHKGRIDLAAARWVVYL
jgi:hypothetical protein